MTGCSVPPQPARDTTHEQRVVGEPALDLSSGTERSVIDTAWELDDPEPPIGVPSWLMTRWPPSAHAWLLCVVCNRAVVVTV